MKKRVWGIGYGVLGKFLTIVIVVSIVAIGALPIFVAEFAPVYAAVKPRGDVKAAWSKSDDFVTAQIDARAHEVTGWLLEHLTEEQRAEFETWLFPPLTKEQQLQAAVTERNLRQLRGKDATDVIAEIETLKQEIVSAQAEAPATQP